MSIAAATSGFMWSCSESCGVTSIAGGDGVADGGGSSAGEASIVSVDDIVVLLLESSVLVGESHAFSPPLHTDFVDLIYWILFNR